MIESIRTALLITLSILVVVIVVRRFRQYVRIHLHPVPQQVHLRAVEVMYHPLRLRIALHLPAAEAVSPALLGQDHSLLRTWPAKHLQAGDHALELPMEEVPEGHYSIELATGTQRTERRFTVRRT